MAGHGIAHDAETDERDSHGFVSSLWFNFRFSDFDGVYGPRKPVLNLRPPSPAENSGTSRAYDIDINNLFKKIAACIPRNPDRRVQPETWGVGGV